MYFDVTQDYLSEDVCHAVGVPMYPNVNVAVAIASLPLKS